jgi:hypothetical protein
MRVSLTNPNIDTTFDKGILHVKFLNNAVVTEKDLQEIYAYGTKCSNALPYCSLFEALGNYEVKEDALAYINKNPHNIFILAKAYVMNTKEAERKIRLHLIFDNPALKPFTFMTAEEAKAHLLEVMRKAK